MWHILCFYLKMANKSNLETGYVFVEDKFPKTPHFTEPLSKDKQNPQCGPHCIVYFYLLCK